MNGYLHNLTMRTLELGNRVEPRLPSLFEAQPFERGPASVREENEQVEPDQQNVSLQLRPQSSTELSHTTRTHTTRIVEGEDPVVEPRAVSATPEREAPLRLNFQSQKEPQTDEPILEENGLVEPSSHSLESADLAPLSHRSDAIETKAAPGQRRPRRGVEAAEALISQKRAIEVDQFPLQPDGEPPASIERVATPSSETNVSEAMEEDPFPTKSFRPLNPTPAAWRNAREQRRRRHALGPVEPEQPSINITIGRVEVRAVQTDHAKPSPRRSESPVMPLEEYLRKQRRGSQR
jgi:hypothetical protein